MPYLVTGVVWPERTAASAASMAADPLRARNALRVLLIASNVLSVVFIASPGSESPWRSCGKLFQNGRGRFQPVLPPPDAAGHEFIACLQQPPPALAHLPLAPHVGAIQDAILVAACRRRLAASRPNRDGAD